MKFILIVLINAEGYAVQSATPLPATSMAMATFETEAACRDVIERWLPSMMTNAGLKNKANIQANCVPAGDAAKTAKQ